ncbi:MAG: hypothetical protein NUV34_08975 [Sulfuricaulis sp.]|nr:hypothetical protein [Sulfuricaulis sp.]
MKEFTATALVKLGAGRVRMDADQAKTRAQNLHPVSDGVFEIVNPIQFKRGERFGWDGEVPKAMAEAFAEIAPVRVADEYTAPVEPVVTHAPVITKKPAHKGFR